MTTEPLDICDLCKEDWMSCGCNASICEQEKFHADWACNYVLNALISRLDENIGAMEDACIEMQNLHHINHTMNKIESFREVIGIIESLREEVKNGNITKITRSN